MNLDAIVARLKEAGIEGPRLEAHALMEYAQGARLEEMVRRRCAREPFVYVVGEKGFWSLTFAIGPGALVPRPETETLIEAALENFPDRDAPLEVLDLGVGSGCLLLTLLHLYPNAKGVGVDASGDALGWARTNAARLDLESHCTLQSGDWTEGIASRFDLIVSNPPYVASGELAGLAPELAFEPQAALDGGADGLDAYRALAPGLPNLLTPKGLVLLEIGAGQAAAVTTILKDSGLETIKIRPDLAGRARCVEARLPPWKPDRE